MITVSIPAKILLENKSKIIEYLHDNFNTELDQLINDKYINYTYHSTWFKKITIKNKNDFFEYLYNKYDIFDNNKLYYYNLKEQYDTNISKIDFVMTAAKFTKNIVLSYDEHIILDILNIINLENNI